MKKYYVKHGCFGTRGKKYISYWKYLLYKIFTDYALYVEDDSQKHL